jgi:hypothetical protein
VEKNDFTAEGAESAEKKKADRPGVWGGVEP